MAQITEVTLPMIGERSRCALPVVLVAVLLAGLLPPVAWGDEPAPEGPQPPVLPEGKAGEVIKIAHTYLGTPYVFGGTSRSGMDTSGLVKVVFVEAGVWEADAPRTAMEQIKVGKVVHGNELQPGDRLYFDFARDGESGRTAPGVADHTGIYIGDGKFIHATPRRARINLLTGSYLDHLIGARRDEELEEARPAVPEGKMGKVIEIACTYLGTPYVFGGESRSGIDPSALVKAVFVEAGVWEADAPRTAMEQIKVGKVVRGNELQPGDRLYFDFARDGQAGRTAPGIADHTGIYIGDGKFIHATPRRARINLLTGSYLDHLIAARRDE